jgi:uncharacterized membrane protein YebE (DUF533 family)
MSLVRTLAKVAIGVAVAKGVSTMVARSGGGGGSAGSAGSGGLFGGDYSPGGRTGAGTDRSAGTGLEGMMDAILGGSARAGQSGPAGQAGGGLGGIGGLLEQLAGGAPGGQPRPGGGGLDDLLGQLADAGGLGGLLGGLAGAIEGRAGQSREGSFGEVLQSQFDTTPEPAKKPTAAQEAAAALMIRAMIQAAKSDGKFDQAEQRKIVEQLGEVGPEERAFVEGEFRRAVDPEGLAGTVPRGLEQQVYMMSVLGIDLDSRAEAQYLDRLARAMEIGKAQVNAIHAHLGAPALYA